MISRFFIDRPIFAAVLSILIVLAGGLAARTLPLAQFPQVTPPTVQVSCNYPGASANDVAKAIAAPIEQQVNGVENMLYMSSQCNNDGSYALTVTFAHGVNLNMAQVLVQNRVSLAMPSLPDVIKQTGVTVLKRSPDILCGYALTTKAHRHNQLYMSNYAILQIRDELLRVPGVSDVFVFGQRDYSMRVWLDPNKMAARNLTAGDVVRAIRAENNQVAAGQIGQQPIRADQQVQVTLDTLGRLTYAEQFEKIILRADPQGRVVRIKDVGRVQLGAKSEDVTVFMDGEETVFLAIFQMPDANALKVYDQVQEKMAELKETFPDGLGYEVAFDTTPYTRESINEVIKTLRDAILLVAAVVLLFLQNWRSAIIPLVAVPVAIIGTFAVMAVVGFSLNNLTLFGLVLAIGIVVDDAIVVVEAVEHHIEHGMSPREASIKAMDQVAGPVIAVGLVLSAVFVPCAFISGITGQFFRQFALTIAVSTIISAFNSLTLSPALTALLLKPRKTDKETGRQGDKETGRPDPLPRIGFAVAGGVLAWLEIPAVEAWLQKTNFLSQYVSPGLLVSLSPCLLVSLSIAAGWLIGKPVNRILAWSFRLFNRGFDYLTVRYTHTVGGILHGKTALLTVILMLAGAWLGLKYGSGLLAAGLVKLAQRHPGWPVPSLMDLPIWAVPVAGVLVGALVGAAAGIVILRLVRLLGRLGRPAQRLHGLVSLGRLRLCVLVLAVYTGLLYLTWWDFSSTPRGFIPNQDMGYLMVNVQLPDAASKERTTAVMRKLEQIGRKHPGIKHVSGIVGQSFILSAYGSNFGSMFINLKEYSLRRDPSLSSDAIVGYLRREFSKVKEAQVAVFGPPPVRGVGTAGGFRIMLEDRTGDLDPAILQKQVDKLVGAGRQTPGLVGLFSVFRANVPQIHIDPDFRAITTKGVSLADFSDTLAVYEGSLYVNDFNRFGRTWQVIVQADFPFRRHPEDLPKLKVRNNQGQMVPLGSLSTIREVNGPLVLTRYNRYPAAAINGGVLPGVSSGEANALMQGLVERQLPPDRSMWFEWTEMSYLEQLAGNTAMKIFAFSVIMVFLVLAAQYESWSLPLAIILVVPLCLLSALVGVNIAHLDVNIFTQVGFVVLVGLASKNAILIVEFARQQRHAGVPREQATLEACRLRLRPIVMTSFAFILGVVPLLIGHGAGAEMRQTLGTAVFAGMLGVTLFGIFLTPVFFYVIDLLGEAVFSPARKEPRRWRIPGILKRSLPRVPQSVTK